MAWRCRMARLPICSARCVDRPGLRDTDIVAAVTTISFDIAALELYLPLMVGATDPTGVP